ncbi:Anaerobic dimethyl sulfoxide reductase chain B [invertebrate metagenome]|uniref:Anaerobic dimethyl sulfoxide reductase chain B n=1 Tax=invertebrate metagenome TaxID=1711999 RepID=A0A2H9T6B9_9ZZZZ
MKDTIFYDAVNCINCFACMAACSTENRLRQKRQGKDLIQILNEEESDSFYLKPVTTQKGSYPDAVTVVGFKHCQHCEKAPCLDNCPSKAIERRPGGQVVINDDACTGCRTCVDVCPFDVPQYNPARNKVSKCIGCFDRVENGLKPACVNACPTGALISGPREEILKKARERKTHYEKRLNKPVVLYGAESESHYVGKLGWITLAPAAYAEEYLLPDSPEKQSMALRSFVRSSSGWGMGLVACAAAVHSLYWLKKRREKIADKEVNS